MRTRVRPESGGFDLYSWFLMRVSGVVLIILVLGHFGYMHLFKTVEAVDYKFVAVQWGSPFWRTYDFLMLVVGLTHGSNGARILISDYIHARGWRALAVATLYTAAFFILVIGGLVIATFRPTVQ